MTRLEKSKLKRTMSKWSLNLLKRAMRHSQVQAVRQLAYGMIRECAKTQAMDTELFNRDRAFRRKEMIEQSNWEARHGRR